MRCCPAAPAPRRSLARSLPIRPARRPAARPPPRDDDRLAPGELGWRSIMRSIDVNEERYREGILFFLALAIISRHHGVDRTIDRATRQVPRCGPALVLWLLLLAPSPVRPSRRERNKHVCAGLALGTISRGGGGGGARAAAEGYVRCGGRVEAEAARARENETGPRHAARGWPAGRAGAGRAELVLLALLS
jgi:hypothetical protein